MDTRELIHTALLVAVCVALGYLMAAVPNVELISVAIFTAGTLKGVRRGALIGALAEGIYAGVNPYGVSPLPLLVSQILGMSVLGAAGGVFARQPAQLPPLLQGGPRWRLRLAAHPFLRCPHQLGGLSPRARVDTLPRLSRRRSVLPLPPGSRGE